MLLSKILNTYCAGIILSNEYQNSTLYVYKKDYQHVFLIIITLNTNYYARDKQLYYWFIYN